MHRSAVNRKSGRSRFGTRLALLRRHLSILLISALACGLGLASTAPSAQMLSLKAAFCYRFLFYIDWPSGSGAETAEDLELCVVRSDRIGQAFEAAFSDVVGEEIKGRRFTVEPIDAEAGLEVFESCSMVFISDDRPEVVKALIGRLGSLSVVTVGDTPGFIDSGGMIGLSVVEESIEYEVNLRAARDADIKLRSRLLKSDLVPGPLYLV